VGVWQGDVSLSYERDLEDLRYPGEPGLLRSPVWFAVVGVVVEAGVKTIMMAGRRGTGAGWTTGAARTGTGVWTGGEGWMSLGASTGWTIGAGGVGAGTGIWMGACKGWSYICKSGRDGTFRFALGFGSSSSSSEPLGSGSSWELIPPLSSYLGPC
jgi:hypothetical protein